MSLNFGVGELVNRVRRALSVQGRMPLDLDERCTINVQTIDVGQAPFRSDGAGWAISTFSPAVAAQLSSVNYFVGGGVNTSKETMRATIRSFVLGNLSAAAVQFIWGTALDVGSPGLNPTTPELNRATFSAQGVSFANIRVVRNASAVALTSDGTLGCAVVPAGSSLVVPVDLTLVPGLGVQLQCQTVNLAEVVAARGEFWTGDGFALA